MNIPSAQQLAEYSLAQQHPATARWTPRNLRLRLLAREHELDVRMATDLEFAAMRRERFGPELPTEYFLNTWEPLGDDLSAMLSARWKGGDPGRSFVDASALSREITGDSDVELLRHAAVQRFGSIRPHYVRWWSRHPAGHYPQTRQDKRFLAAPIRDLVDADVPAALGLRVTQDLDHYDDACAAYAAVDHAHPEHPGQAAIESAEDLDELRRVGTLYDVLLDGRWSGYVGAERGHKLGLDGYKVAELILTEAARGRGLGRCLTTLLAEALVTRGPSGHDVIIGTIHYDNLGARRAAELAGRRDIGGWVCAALI
ncbi:hypothetical protein GCM10011575_41170 [Microlunatus endophyticus]|uniref:Uncharacterized protein n=1 Tax=Microlunatus endophyticus TaxID=1716077 RepID=A0A917SFB4_9ACTN|nr:hypothetical protein [Microlunatus endophyticus]GGL78574.1 hypothetical protein GCM10011575_41170 [Microlunatus endophyticus]